MDSEMKWTLETYRLDEIEGKFKFPCVVCVNEGYYSETDAEGFSQGDIISIDSKTVLHKVAANFAEHIKEEDTNSSCKDYVELEREILVPLNYKGRLQVLMKVKDYGSVRDLATENPRYAKVMENMKVNTGENIEVTIKAGTVIELDRIIPGSMYGKCRKPDELVIQFKHSSGPLDVGVPLDTRGKFRTEPDYNEYTIKEAIDRYSLPQHVRFVDDKIRRVYTQDLLEGIENMSTITETLRLNRLVTQNVLIGHYKPLDESETNDTERFRHRTLVVLPIDNSDISDIEVNVLKGVTDDVYEHVFLVRNISNSNTEDIVEGCLYVDFAMRPGIKIISHDDDENNEDKPPPRPPKPGNLAPQVAPKQRTRGSKSNKSTVAGAGNNKDDDGDDDDIYIFPETDRDQPTKISPKTGKEKKKPSKIKASCSHDFSKTRDSSYEEVSPTSTIYAGFSLADMDFASIDSEKGNSLGKKFMSNIKSTFKAFKGFKDRTPAKSVDEPSGPSHEITTHTTQGDQASGVDEEGIQGIYDEVNEMAMIDNTVPQSETHTKRSIKRDRGTYLKTVTYHDKHGKPTAHVQPSVSHSVTRKKFKDLNNKELVERLHLCGLPEMADFCKEAQLNGAFFNNLTSNHLKENMNLKGIALAKFIQMKDENWVPT